MQETVKSVDGLAGRLALINVATPVHNPGRGQKRSLSSVVEDVHIISEKHKIVIEMLVAMAALRLMGIVDAGQDLEERVVNMVRGCENDKFVEIIMILFSLKLQYFGKFHELLVVLY